LELVAAVTSKSDREMQEIAPFSGVICKDYQKLGDLKASLDGVIIATPPQGRQEIIEFFLESGVPVFAEKPLTLDARETMRLIGKARRLGIPLIEDFTHLYTWPYIAISEQLAAQDHINIESIGGNSGPVRDYSPVYDYGPHDLSMTLQVFKTRPRIRSVKAFDQLSANAFSIRTELDFGSRGTACLTFGNTFTDKQRVFRCGVNDDEWTYDGTAAEKLTRNGRPYKYDGYSRNFSALELALLCFAGNSSLYRNDECLWLSECVAELAGEIAGRV
jgi:predicted dehydrogenase